MDNKNEKTFSDLFLDANDEKVEELKDEKITFDSLSSVVNEDDETLDESNISFSNIADIGGNDDDSNEDSISFNQFSSDILSDSVNETFTVEDNFGGQVLETFGNALNEVSNSIDDGSDIFEVNNDDINTYDDMNEMSGDEVSSDEEVNEVDIEDTENIFIGTDNVEDSGEELIDEKVETNPFMEETEVSDDIISNEEVNKVDIDDTENIFIDTNNVEDSVEELIDEKVVTNPFMEETEVSDDIISNEEVNEVDIEDTKNIFIDTNNVEDSVDDMVVVDNPFIEEVSIKNNSNVGVIDKTDNDTMNETKKTNNEFSSPFFVENSFNEVTSNPLFSNSISLDEAVTSSSNVGKLDLSNTKHFDVKVVPKKEPLSKFIIGVISYAFFIWLLLIGVALLVYVLDIKIRASKGDYSAPTFNAYVVLTGSMLPEIQVNDVVITKRTDAGDLEVGDIITFASADSRFLGTIITHRIIKKNQDKEGNITFQTQGDNNKVADNALVPESNIYGKVILKIPKLGYLQEFLATDGGWIVVILIPCLVVISYDVVKIAKGIKKKKINNIKVQSR